MMRDFIEFIMLRRLNSLIAAGIFGAASLLFMPAAILSGGVISLIWLRRGATEGMIVAAGAAVIVGLAWYLVPLRPGFLFPLVLGLFPCVFLGAAALRRFASQGLMVTAVGALCLLYVAISHGVLEDVAGYWREWLKIAVKAVPGSTVVGFEKDGTVEYMNAFMAALIGGSTAASVLLGRWMQSVAYNPKGFAIEFCELRLSVLILVGLVGLKFAGRWLQSTTLQNDVLALAILLFGIQGLAVIHGVVRIRNLSWIFVLPPYALLFWSPQSFVEGVAALGAIDTLVDFRRRANPRTKNS